MIFGQKNPGIGPVFGQKLTSSPSTFADKVRKVSAIVKTGVDIAEKASGIRNDLERLRS